MNILLQVKVWVRETHTPFRTLQSCTTHWILIFGASLSLSGQPTAGRPYRSAIAMTFLVKFSCAAKLYDARRVCSGPHAACFFASIIRHHSMPLSFPFNQLQLRIVRTSSIAAYDVDANARCPQYSFNLQRTPPPTVPIVSFRACTVHNVCKVESWINRSQTPSNTRRCAQFIAKIWINKLHAHEIWRIRTHTRNQSWFSYIC